MPISSSELVHQAEQRTIRRTASPRDVPHGTSQEAGNDGKRRDAPHGASPTQVLTMKFYYVYVLESKSKDFIYVGFTDNLKRCLTEHNKGQNKSTKAYAPYELIHYEAYRNEQDAKRREIYLKTTKGKTTLRVMLKDFL